MRHATPAEYLAASYDPDVAYVDGTLVERNVGDWLHSLIQRNLIVALSRKYPHLFAMPELGSRTKGTRYRPPDVCVLKTPPQGRYLLEGRLDRRRNPLRRRSHEHRHGETRRVRSF